MCTVSPAMQRNFWTCAAPSGVVIVVDRSASRDRVHSINWPSQKNVAGIPRAAGDAVECRRRGERAIGDPTMPRVWGMH
jgi:hypothetical protein